MGFSFIPEYSYVYHHNHLCYFSNFILCAWVSCLHCCLCTTCACDTHRGQRKVLNPMELEVNIVVSCHVVAASALHSLTISSAS